jgi:replicative DNA helicase
VSRDLTPVPAQPNDTTDELPPVSRLRDALVETLEAVERLHEEHGELTGVPTGFPELDRLTSGLQPGNLIVIAGRPSVGKTTLALDCARHAAVRAGVPTLLCSLELNQTEVSQRLMCAQCSVDLHRLRIGRMEESDWTRLTRSLTILAEASLWVDDMAVSSVSTIRAQAERIRRQHGLGLLVVDGIQALLPFRPVENLYEHVSYSVRGLKVIARELNIPVVVTSPVSRQTEARADHRPLLSDLRDSGALEDTADLIIFIYRDELYDVESPRKGEADLILAKHRNGPTDAVTVTFQGQYSRFTPMASRDL